MKDQYNLNDKLRTKYGSKFSKDLGVFLLGKEPKDDDNTPLTRSVDEVCAVPIKVTYTPVLTDFVERSNRAYEKGKPSRKPLTAVCPEETREEKRKKLERRYGVC